MEHDFLTIPQVARRLQLGTHAVRELISTRAIPSIRIGRSVRIPRPGLERFVAEAGQQEPG